MSFNIGDLEYTPNGWELIKQVNNGEITINEAIMIGAKDILKEKSNKNNLIDIIVDAANVNRV